MMRTVDLVVAGDGSAARAAAVDALQRGRRVLVVLRSPNARLATRLRRCLCKTANADTGQVTVMKRAEVVCVDGVGGVEAVVIRYVRTGRLYAVNASTFLSCDGSSTPARGR
jgi:thioredoxin reductase